MGVAQPAHRFHEVQRQGGLIGVVRQGRLEQRKRPRGVAAPQNDLGPPPAQVLVVGKRLGQLLEQHERLGVIPLPAEHVGQEALRLLVQGLRLQRLAALFDGPLEILGSGVDPGQREAVLAGQGQSVVHPQGVVIPARRRQHAGQLLANRRLGRRSARAMFSMPSARAGSFACRCSTQARRVR